MGRARTAGNEPRPARRRLSSSWILSAVVTLSVSACSAETEVGTTGSAPSTSSTAVAETVELTAPSTSADTTTTSPSRAAPPPTRAPLPPTTAAPQTTPPQVSQTGFAVRSVTDGDTFTLADGRRVRLAQVDAPEANECFGSQSTAALRALVQNKTVALRRPPDGPELDRYGRTLADVSVAGRSVNEQLVRDGAAEWYEQFAAEDGELAGRLRSAENDAKEAGKGLWSACVSAAPEVTSPPTTQATVPADGNCHPAYPDDCIPPAPPDLDCPDITRKVRVDHAHGDPHRFDADNDGWGCDSYG
ncbi:MAG: nuclease [Actinobacteria bacterium]|nr:MAG: nuclease [Actinomycetota bacterium]